ncbi:hypothetical protein RP29_07695 [Acidovorax temperans]|uniref:DNA-binding response OmpR family regulator n=1 Tax=Acidovorax temperans TaxID=80878 RepID=A0A0D7KAM4_9BURK|nr:response regulator transcription factor [Acidovorax temperans]KJA11059.1 hypothetical protein RP29_07695 [Acidovorax temperans]
MDTGLNIVVIEDNDDLREATVHALRRRGYPVIGLPSAEALPEESSWQRIDILVVDLNLPGEDGLSLVSRIRAIEPGVGVIMVTARGLPADRQAGYEHGADIYITKPASLPELEAAIGSLSRRMSATQQHPGDLRLDQAQHRLSGAHQLQVQLTGQECALIVALARAADKRLETWQLIDILDKGSADDPKRALEIVITRLRKKLEQAGCAALHIRSIRNWGYQLKGAVLLG